jgi:hypothetical protein
MVGARSGFGLPSSLKYTSRVAPCSGVVQLVAHGPLEPRILVRVQAPEPSCLGALSTACPHEYLDTPLRKIDAYLFRRLLLPVMSALVVATHCQVRRSAPAAHEPSVFPFL